MNTEKQRKRALVISFDGKEKSESMGQLRLQPRQRRDRGIAQREHQCRVTDEASMEKFLNEDHVVLYAEFRKSGGTPSPGVVRQFDQITRDMLASARSTQVVATLIRAELGLSEIA